MLGHEIVGVFMAIVVGAVVISALSPGSNTATVLSSSATGFSSVLTAMKGG
jgi:threonine/homoserine/homoserine lactone efflux protein